MSSPFLAGQLIKTSTQRDALGAVTAGTMIYNSTLGALQIYIDGAWQTLANTITTDAIASDVTTNASDILTKQPTIKHAKIRDRKALDEASGTFSNGGDRTRDLNYIEYDTIGISVSANQFTLPAGTYKIRVIAPVYAVNRHRCMLYDITNTALICHGLLQFAFGSGSVSNSSHLETVLTISASTTYEIRHRCEVTGTTIGFGTQATVAAGFADYGYYTDVWIDQLA